MPQQDPVRVMEAVDSGLGGQSRQEIRAELPVEGSHVLIVAGPPRPAKVFPQRDDLSQTNLSATRLA